MLFLRLEIWIRVFERVLIVHISNNNQRFHSMLTECSLNCHSHFGLNVVFRIFGFGLNFGFFSDFFNFIFFFIQKVSFDWCPRRIHRLVRAAWKFKILQLLAQWKWCFKEFWWSRAGVFNGCFGEKKLNFPNFPIFTKYFIQHFDLHHFSEHAWKNSCRFNCPRSHF